MEVHLEPPLKPEFELKSFEFSGEPYERGFSYGAACRDGISRFLQESFYDVFSLGETIEASKERMPRDHLRWLWSPASAPPR